ncbi:TylF/MycF/NovP-related O-methyltransferase [Sphingomonas suaedae]|nr:TylF/MycF/NovP-related O-methyltransferase [Sphingomonas suaedae]
MLLQLKKAVKAVVGHPSVEPVDLIPELTDADQAIIERVRPFTLTSPEKLWSLIQSVRYVSARQIPGDFVELGVWRGGSSMAAALALKEIGDHRRMWLYDTYEGMSEPTELDRKTRSGAPPAMEKWQQTRIGDGSDWCRAGIDDVTANMTSTGYPGEIRYVVGKAEETLEREVPETISVLRIDTDWHAPTKAAMDILYDRLSPGGILILDDYGSWEGARVAVDDYFRGKAPMLMHRLDRGGRLIMKV